MKSISNEYQVGIIIGLIFVGIIVAITVGVYLSSTSTILVPLKPELGDYIDASGAVVATISKHETIDNRLKVTIKVLNGNETFIIGLDRISKVWSKTFVINGKVIKYNFFNKEIKKSEPDINTSDNFLHFVKLKI
jgi:hypothetical protein